MNKEQLIKQLNQQVANWSLLYVKLHNYHWNVRGVHFFELHAKFEELYNEAAANVDQIAERVIALQGKPLGTMKEYLAESSLTEASGAEKPEAMLEALFHDYEVIGKQLKEGIAAANQLDDDVTVDMLTQMLVTLEQHHWMFRAFLG